MTLDPVWITGVGALTPLGHTYAQIAERLLAGVSGVRRVSAFPVDDHPTQIAGTIDAIPCPAGWPEHDFAQLASVDQVTLWCCVNALQDAGWWTRRGETRIGIALGNAAEWS